MQSDLERESESGAPAPMGRRDLLMMAMGAGLSLVLPAAALAADATWVAVGKPEQFVLNQPQQVVLPKDAGTLWITRTEKTKLIAVSAKCTHRGCTVGWDATNKQFLCPCHGAVFQTDGTNVHGPKRKPEPKLASLPPVPVKEDKKQVLVDLTAAAAAIKPPSGEQPTAPPAAPPAVPPAPAPAPAPQAPA